MPQFNHSKLGFLLFGILSCLCYPSIGRLERKHSMITPISLRRHSNNHPSSSCLSEDIRSCIGLENFDAALEGPSDQYDDECWPNCPVIYTVTISQGLSPLPTNAFTVTIGGNIATTHTLTSTHTASSSLTSDVQSSILSDPTSTTDTSFTSTTFVSTPAPIFSGGIVTQVNKLSSTSPTSATAAPASTSSSTSANLQTFDGALGNIPAPPVFDTGTGEFSVEGNSSFDNKQNALTRSCDVQHNDCGNAANADHDASFTVNDCDAQEAQCKAIAGS
ncbi:hypothetical protein C8J55DRAFT_497984 [Lentinula edodes]|uniref:Uncharacterized protein n=1 Tax=Lentinula lateritia TaxID=40482 RepID=A0A9W9E0N7_9AGAR|nr:hypothetical protein C8J55DRAFT_497984 [Lentinula edodes]